MKEFTKGPWSVVDGFDEDGNGVYFPHVLMKKEDGEDSEVRVIINMSHDQEPKSIMANAHLISASPTMYEALKIVLRLLIDDKQTHDTHNGTGGYLDCLDTGLSGPISGVLGRAIAKAEGK